MWKVLNLIQGILIAVWTGVCAIIGMLLLLITFNRKFVMWFSSRWLWSPVLCAIAGVRVRGHHIDLIDQKNSYIYVANHSSLFDIVAVCRVSPVSMFYVAKKELKKLPLMGQFMAAVGMIFIDRKNKDKAMESMRAAGEKIKSGRNVLTYPEGTRSNDGKVQVFRRGSFIIAKEAEVGIAPISIKGAFKVLSAGSMGLRPGVIDVYFHAPVQPEEFRGMNVEALAEHCRSIVASKI